MSGQFDGFVIFAEMRTGSNHLEASLDALADVTCYGEVFNPVFIGGHNKFELFGYDLAHREADPIGLLDTILLRTEGLPGFRLFHDHDDRVIDRVLQDRRIAKIILTRNPLDSYVSRKIATATGQWILKDVKQKKSAKARFEEREFLDMLQRLQNFQLRLQRGLQTSGQTAFYIRYDDINDADVLNGLAAFIGSQHQVDAASGKLKKQNPSELAEKVENPADMAAAVARIDRFDLNQTPNFEPPRHAGVPGFVVHPDAGLLFMPIKGGPEEEIVDWMAGVGGVGRSKLLTGMTQKDLRQWIKAHPGYRSFTVVRHPVARAHQVFSTHILPADVGAYRDPRHAMRQRYNVNIPKDGPNPRYDRAQHRDAFLAYLQFLKGNLAGQTSVRIDNAWATQTSILQGAANFALPHRIVQEEAVAKLVPALAAEAGVTSVPKIAVKPCAGPFDLADIYDRDIEKACVAAYRRDYFTFGFEPWQAA